jgi:hypothetical protein
VIHRIYAVLFSIWRPRRWQRLRAAFALRGDESILDVGGTLAFWTRCTDPPQNLLIANSDPLALRTDANPRLVTLVADGCALPFADRTFDVAFSNSVIEHVGSWPRQQVFAAEARRVARRIWIQTPARNFLIEPHFLGPPLHSLPTKWQPFVARWFTVRGWIDPRGTAELTIPGTIRLLTRREMQELFPDCTINTERFLGLAKSFIAVRNSP